MTTTSAVTLPDRLAEHAREMPDRLAFKFLRDGCEPDTFTFGRLERRVRTLAAYLREHAAPGDRALLLYPPGLEFVAAFLACLAAGVIAVPAYPPRRNRAHDRLASISHDCSPRLVLTTAETAPAIDTESLGGSGGWLLLATDAVPGDASPPPRSTDLDPNGIAFLQYTSGSTRTPRGVMVTHAALLANQVAGQTALGLSRDSLEVSWLPLFHDMGLIGTALLGVFVGYPTVLLSPRVFLREPFRWLEAISCHGATKAGGPNFAYEHCLRRVSAEQKSGLDLSRWSIAFNGAEPVRADTLDRFAAEFACCGFRPRSFFPCYGLAEATLFASGGPPQRSPRRASVSGPGLERHQWDPVPEDHPHSRTLVGCGRLAPGTTAAIVDPRTCTRCPPGVVGEVWLASDSVAAGYWNNAEETRSTFRAYLADTGEGPFLRTGDLGYLAEGELFITGRLKDLIIVRGRNIYPQDVEAVVERAVGTVGPSSCAAFGVTADGEERLAVVVEANRELVRIFRRTAAIHALIGRARREVADGFEVELQAVTFVRPGSFPRTTSGKVRRAACRALAEQPGDHLLFVWRGGDPEPAAVGEASRPGQVEVRNWLLRTLAVRLGVPSAELDDQKPIRDYGFDSLSLSEIHRRFEAWLGARLDPIAFWQYPTVRALAEYAAGLLESKEAADVL